MEFSLFGIIAMPVIAVISYGVGVVVKSIPKINDDLIPAICIVCGAILGPVGYFVIPKFPATDVMSAIAVGIVSGLAATGANQIVKKIKKAKETTDEE
mgnify:CR=1 FL=1